MIDRHVAHPKLGIPSRLLDHRAGVSLLLGPLPVGEFDGRDQPIAQDIMESALENESQRGRAELDHEPTSDFHGPDAEHRHDHGDEYCRSQAARHLLYPIEMECFEHAVVEEQPQPEPQREHDADNDEPFEDDIAANRSHRRSSGCRIDAEGFAASGDFTSAVAISISHRIPSERNHHARRSSFLVSHSTESNADDDHEQRRDRDRFAVGGVPEFGAVIPKIIDGPRFRDTCGGTAGKQFGITSPVASVNKSFGDSAFASAGVAAAPRSRFRNSSGVIGPQPILDLVQVAGHRRERGGIRPCVFEFRDSIRARRTCRASMSLDDGMGSSSL